MKLILYETKFSLDDHDVLDIREGVALGHFPLAALAALTLGGGRS
jgi:hypothetical protein